MRARRDRPPAPLAHSVARRLGVVLAVVVAAGGLSGCSLGSLLPRENATTGAGETTTGASDRAAGRSASAPAVHHNEIPTPPGPEERAAASPTPAVALRRFATAYVNWDAADVAARMRGLAADSVGQARSALSLTAQQTGADPELAQAGIANRGTVQAVAPLAGSADRYVVVTLESTSATNSSAYEGIAPAWHLTLAAVVRRDGGWVVSAWQPED